ncbi:MAG: RdgB/HAM1 family non-canonical purine NTP pyrophosphatase [Methylomonas sp.]|nr:RdgB/HAM1 family non-canonical purine NTP pyrophosphatase [Methylomonas sp.]
MTSIVLASSNPGKIREIQAILQNDNILPQSQFNVTEPDEIGSTFIENAIIKARNAALRCKLPAIADDSGLVVDALNGAPGVISARYAGPRATDKANLNKVLKNLKDVPPEHRTARFVCVMVYMRHAADPTPLIAQGVWEGRILSQAVGENGFGYDPIFWVEEYQCSSAQLSAEQKNGISHRWRALQLLSQQIAKL